VVTATTSGEPVPGSVVTPPEIGGPMSTGRFARGLGGVVVGGLVIRVGYVLCFTRYENGKLYDAFWYGVTSNELSQGQFFRTPFGLAPTAAHPPLTSLLVGGAGFIVGRHAGSTVQRLTMAVLGAAVVLVVGLLGRAVAGPWVGLTAAGLGAVYPNLWMPSGIVMSETPSMLLMALILVAVVRVLGSPTVANVVLLGAACGAEVLVRAELALFVPALLVPVVLAARRTSMRRRLGLLAVGVVTSAVVVAPWVGRNLAAFKDTTTISTGTGLALLGANCPQTYAGPSLGSWSLGCAASVPGSDESVQSARAQHAAFRYTEHHAGRIPVVVMARIGRLWDLYEPIQMADVDVNEGRPVPASLAGLGFYYALVPLGVAGIVILRRYRIAQWFLLVPAGVVTVVSALVYGSVRFRAPFEVCLVVLAAPPLVLGAGALRRRMAGVRLHRRRPIERARA
jgi:4-amino-4-deoxy-L-arabinose transferase-like glycosyltransferase